MAFTGFGFLEGIFRTSFLIEMISDLDWLDEGRRIGPKVGDILSWISDYGWNGYLVGMDMAQIIKIPLEMENFMERRSRTGNAPSD